MKKILLLLILAALVVVGFYGWQKNHRGNSSPVRTSDYKNISYFVEGNKVTLVNGISVIEAASGSVSKITTKYFGNGASGDLGNEGGSVAFILTQNSGGSGTFYYIVAALGTDVVNQNYIGTNAILLGDRIAPQTTEIRDGMIIVNYVERKAGEPFTAQPSVAVSRYFKIMEGNLVEIKKPGTTGFLETHKDLITLSSPISGAKVANPLTVTGKARGNWYFEASFPVELLDGNGKQIAIVPAQAQGEWMTTEFVPFKATLTFTKPTTTTGTLILRKDNPSGLPEHDDFVSIPVKF